MKNLKTNRVIALKQVGISRKDVEDYRKSSREYFVQYRGRESNVITQELLSKIKILADVRRNMEVEIAGVLFEDNLNVTFIFYINGDPKDAFYERNCFMSVSDSEEEIDRQIAPNFIPDMENQKHVICKYGHELEIYSVNE